MLDVIQVDDHIFMSPHIKWCDDGMRALMGPCEALKTKDEPVNELFRIDVVRQHHQLADVCGSLARVRPNVEGPRGNYNSLEFYHDSCVELFIRFRQIADRFVLIWLFFKLSNYVQYVVILLLGIDRFQIWYADLQIRLAHQSYIQVIIWVLL